MKRTPKQREALKAVSEGRFYPTLVREEDGWYARWRAVGAPEGLDIDGWVDEYVRAAALTRLTEDAEEQQHETLHDAWMMALKSRTGAVLWDDDACAAFAAELEEWSGGADADVEARRALMFALRLGEDGKLASSVLTTPIPRTRRGLKALGQAAYVWGSLSGFKRQGETELSLTLSGLEAEEFVLRGARALSDAGYGVTGLPKSARITASAELEDGQDANQAPSVKLIVHVDGEAVRADEIRFLLDQGSSLVFFRNRWIEVNRSILKEALRALERGVGKKPNLMSFAMGIGHVGSLEIESLKAHGWLRGLVHELGQNRANIMPEVKTIPGLTATLRPYQAQGVAWLKFLTTHGFGALLADDMGLGKTIQTIAWLLSTTTSESTFPTLIVAPLTLLANWKHELAAFAPEIKVYVHQGDGRHFGSGFKRLADEVDVVLTSYTLLVKDYSVISEVSWGALVLDEAQAIKNPDTQVARAVKALSPARRIALTGTPIENSVRDVWAIEDFLNPGFLGDRKSFQQRFVRPLALDAESRAGKRLKHALEPFILRRLKTDPEIVTELGEKREVREYCQLGITERRAYEAALASYRATEHTAGDVFALLTELKLICDGCLNGLSSFEPTESGKFAHLVQILESIFETGESALVFTQYAKVGAALQTALAQKFGRRFPFLHGSLSATAREGEIRKFNRPQPQAFILSLKAGGFGLNLTKATHVIHFDRWWNPAVENQATDRAHRIGQERDVLVHLMITEGTVEERVDELLRKKATLKDLVSNGQEFWKAVRLT